MGVTRKRQHSHTQIHLPLPTPIRRHSDTPTPLIRRSPCTMRHALCPLPLPPCPLPTTSGLCATSVSKSSAARFSASAAFVPTLSASSGLRGGPSRPWRIHGCGSRALWCMFARCVKEVNGMKGYAIVNGKWVSFVLSSGLAAAHKRNAGRSMSASEAIMQVEGRRRI